MKKLILSALCISLLTACQMNNEAEREALQNEEGGRTLVSNPGEQELYVQEDAKSRVEYHTTKMGYSRRQKSDVNNVNDRSQVAYVNRETLANMITDMQVKLPDITDAATMVTDDEVFVVYRANTTDPTLAADQVYKTAASVVPRYYHIYTSTEQKLMTQMEGLKSGRMNDKEFTGTIDMLKREMSDHPAAGDNNEHIRHMSNGQTGVDIRNE